jgi:hypothetical protein
MASPTQLALKEHSDPLHSDCHLHGGLSGMLAIRDASAFGYNAQESYVNLLGSWGQIVFLAYFGGRTAEKIMEMKAKK